MPKAKPFSGPVDSEVARQLLNSSGVRAGESLLGDALQESAQRLSALVQEANQTLDGNKFAQIVADHLATELNRRGRAHLSVSETGDVVLHISYEESAPAPKTRRKRATPLMQDLKKKAQELGVDIRHLGIKRTEIQKYLDSFTKGSEVPQVPRAKTATPQAELRDEPEPGPMSAGPDETTISEMPETLPLRRSNVKNAETSEGPVLVDSGSERSRVSKPSKSLSEEPKGRSMRQLVQDSKDVNISDLLASDPPK